MAQQSRVQIVIDAQDRASAKLKGVGRAASGLKSSIGGLLPILGVAGLAFAFTSVIKGAAAFEQQLADISTLISGDSTKAIADFKKGIQELSKVTPKDPKELGAAAYSIVSAGITDTAEALAVLKESTKLAISGLGTTEEATDLLTSALNAFGIDAKDSQKTASILFNTVKQGKTTVRELAQSFGMVAPIAAEMGVSLTELQAATAALTLGGAKASIAQTQLRAAMSSLLKPTADAADLFEKLGVVSFKELIVKSGGLVNAFGKLKEASAGNEEQLAKAAGSVEGLSAILSLTGAQAEAFTTTLNSMENSTESYEEAVLKQNETATAQFQIMKNNLNVVFQDLALKLLPALIVGMKAIPVVIDVVSDHFMALVDALTAVFLWFIKVENKLNEIQDRVFGFVGKVGSTIGGVISKIPFFADGGIVTRPTLAVVGESGPEAIIPLRRGGGFGGGITINMTNPMFLDRLAAEKFADQLMDVLKNNLKL